MDDELAAGLPPEEDAKEVVAAIKRWMQAPSFRDGLPHLLGRRQRLVEKCGHILAHATPELFADIMNGIKPKQRNLVREMTVETAEHLLGTLTASELADMVETALEWTPTPLSAWNYFDGLWRVEVNGYPTSDSGDRIVRLAQQARRWLGQSKERGRPPKHC